MIPLVTHEISIGEGICIGYGAAFTALCSCGWTGPFSSSVRAVWCRTGRQATCGVVRPCRRGYRGRMPRMRNWTAEDVAAEEKRRNGLLAARQCPDGGGRLIFDCPSADGAWPKTWSCGLCDCGGYAESEITQ